MMTSNVAPYGPYNFVSYACAICQSTRKRTVMKKTGAAVMREFEIVKCLGCGHIYVDPRIANDDISSLYDERYYTGRGFDRTVNYVVASSADKERETAAVIATVRDAVGSNVRGLDWLDFGCGSGALLAGAAALGAHAVGFDESSEARGLCAEKGLRVLRAAELEALHAGFDIVTALEVIEHVPDPIGFLRDIVSLLRVGGVAYIQTGNWNLTRRVRGTPYIMPEGHIQYFTPPIMRRLFSQVGLAEVAAFNRSWFPYRDLTPAFLRERLPVGAFSGLAAAVRLLAPEYAPFPIGRKLA